MPRHQLTLDLVFQTICERHAGKNAVIFEDQTLTYKELHQNTYRLAESLVQMGIRTGDRVAIILPNCLEYLYLYFALFMIGAWAVPLSTRWEADEIFNVLSDAGAGTVIFKDRIGILNFGKILAQLKDRLPLLKQLIPYQCGNGQVVENVDASDLLSLIAAKHLDDKSSQKPIENNIKPDDVALLAYTSGTTGKPKGVMISHQTLVQTSYHTSRIWCDGDEIAFSVAPLYAAQGFLAVLIDLVAGITMKWHPNFNPHDIMAEIAKGGVNTFHTQPTMWTILLSQPYLGFLDLKHLSKVVVSGSLCSYELAKRIESEMGCKLLNGYGLIEGTGVVTLSHLDDPEDIRMNTVGRPIPGVELKIVDENRLEVENGQVGEIAVRGYLMNGYYRNKAQTRKVIDEAGWLYTGDLGLIYDEHKNLKIVGRIKDMIIRGGFNVYPIDIENCLMQYDPVQDVAVVGQPDDILGESIVAVVIPKPGNTLTPGDVRRFCRGKIANYKMPDEVIFVSQFPTLLSGKIQKNVLRQWVSEGVPGECRLLFNGCTINELPN